MPSIQTASVPVTLFPERFSSPFENEDLIPLYSSVPLASPVVGCLPCAVCGTSEVRNQVITSSQIAGATNAGLPGGTIGGQSTAGPIVSPTIPPAAHVPTNVIDLNLPGAFQISEDKYRQYYNGGTWTSTLVYNLSEYYVNFHSTGTWAGSAITLPVQTDSFLLTGITDTNSPTWQYTGTHFPPPNPPAPNFYHYSWGIQVTLGLAKQNSSWYAVQFTFPGGSTTGACIGRGPGTGYPATTVFEIDGMVIPTYGCKSTGTLLSNSNNVLFYCTFTPSP